MLKIIKKWFVLMLKHYFNLLTFKSLLRSLLTVLGAGSRRGLSAGTSGLILSFDSAECGRTACRIMGEELRGFFFVLTFSVVTNVS